MGIIEIFILGVGLSMDAFAVSICKGLSVRKPERKHFLLVALYFGGFQALMPVIGYFMGIHFQKYIEVVDHWIAFFLLGFIGVNMIREALSAGEEETDASFAPREMFSLAVATSIDALAVGVMFAFLNVHVLPAAGLIGVTTAVLSVIGLRIGHIFGMKYKKKAEIIGGLVLIMIGVKILVEDLL